MNNAYCISDKSTALGLVLAATFASSAAAQDGRIVGGTVAPAGRFPAMAALPITLPPPVGTVADCGATVINPRWVLTAAHCSTPASVLVDTLTISSGGRRIAIAERVDHPTLDVALLRLAEDAGVRPAAVNSGAWGLAADGVGVTVSGWGRTSEGGQSSDVLLEANVAIIANATCNAADWYNGRVTANEICAGLAPGGVDTCQGDSGGPLWQDVAGSFNLIGVTSWGSGCARAKKPGVYVRASSVAEWIGDSIGPYGIFSLQTATALEQTSSNFAFALADNGDLFAIKKSSTGSGKTEVHVLTAASRYRQFSLHTATPLAPTGSNAEFALASNRDLFLILKSSTGSKTTEVHVLTAASNYQQFSLHTGTALHETGSTFQFAVAPNRDLFAIKKSGTPNNKTEVHVLSAASNYQQFSLHAASALHATGDNAKFLVAPNRDLVLVLKNGTGSRTTEVHTLTAASNYQSFSLHTGSALRETDTTFDFVMAQSRDIVAIAKSGNASGRTDVQVLAQ